MTQTSQAEREFYYFQYGSAGGFMTALFTAMMKADLGNLHKLKQGFPEEVDVVYKYQNEPGYWEDLCERMNS